MLKILRTAKRLQSTCEKAGLPFCIIGALAVQRWGEPRLTNDADAMVYTGVGDEGPVIQALLKKFMPRREDAAEFALTWRVLLLQDTPQRIGIDVSLGATPFEERVIVRSSPFAFQPTISLRTCSAEDLIVFKAFAARDIDWNDVKGILIRQKGRLDYELIERELAPLVDLKEEPVILERWHQLRDRYRR